jgi:hypothetical protein
MRKHNRRGIHAKNGPDDFAGVDRSTVESAGEEAFDTTDAMPIVEPYG